MWMFTQAFLPVRYRANPIGRSLTSHEIPQVLYHDDGSVKGVATADVGVAKDGSPKVNETINISYTKRLFRLVANGIIH